MELNMSGNSDSVANHSNVDDNVEPKVENGRHLGTMSKAIMIAMRLCPSLENVAVAALILCAVYFFSDPFDTMTQVRSLIGVLIVRFFVKAERRVIQFGAVKRYNDDQKTAKERIIQAASKGAQSGQTQQHKKHN